MPWARIDDHANTNAKLLALSDSAFRLWVCGLIYCQSHLTDGFIPASMVPTFGVKAKKINLHISHELCAALVPGKAPLWHEVDGGYQVHHYADWNDTRQIVMGNRERTAERQRRFKERRDQTVSNASTNALPDTLVTAPTPPTHTTPPTPPTKGGDNERPTTLINGAEMRRHGTHRWCGRKCVPYSLHDDFVRGLGTATADAQLVAWYPVAMAKYDGRPVGDDVFDFWRNEFAAWVGTVTSKPVTASTRASRNIEAGRRTMAAIERGEI